MTVKNIFLIVAIAFALVGSTAAMTALYHAEACQTDNC